MSALKRTIPRPPARLILTTPEHLIAFGFGAGLAPVAPGTFGTLVGIPFFLVLMWLPWEAYLAVVALLFVFGCWVCGASSRLLQVHDYPGFVFDEIVGFLVTCVPLLPAFGLWPLHPALGLLAAFLLFRLSDVLKPWPIHLLDRHVHGGLGIMLDDAAAGLLAGLAVWGLTFLL
ncbi:phosphatidylglycerophosphatase A [Panacagrimonas sp.]|uniref:phosphatidylglycerophosphatase A family protein n=1 Tax=Panacagrimonas sp. TaxID=2480088 RepID=UPI003B529337